MFTNLSDEDAHQIINQHLKPISQEMDELSNLDQVGKVKWSERMAALQKLNIKAALDAKIPGGTEQVGETLISEQGSLTRILCELLLCQTWRRKVLPLVRKQSELLDEKKSDLLLFQIYLISVGEANIVNLLETIAFDVRCLDSLGEEVLDLAEYVVHELQDFIADYGKGTNNPEVGLARTTDSNREVHDQINNVNKQKALKCISILRYLTECVDNPSVDSIPLCLSNRLVMSPHDVPVMVVALIKCETCRWNTKDGSNPNPEESQSANDMLETQLWITLHNMMTKEGFISKYDLTNYRVSVLIGLIQYFPTSDDNGNPHLAQLLPYLEDLKKWFIKLQIERESSKVGGNDSMSSSNTFTKIGSGNRSSKLLIIESVARMHTYISNRYCEKDFEKIAKEHITSCENMKIVDDITPMQEMIFRTIDAFDKHKNLHVSNDQRVGRDPDKTEIKEKEARKQCDNCDTLNSKCKTCSRCGSAFYCNASCQKEHWPDHKSTCNLIYKTNKERDELKEKKIIEID